MEQIRNVRYEELDESLKLSSFAFQYELDAKTLGHRRAEIDLEQLIGYFVDDKLASQLTLLPLSVWLGGKRFDMGGIAGVATWPEYRRKGQVGKLLRHSLQVMKDRGMTVSMLHPFSFAFYRKYGWEMMVDYQLYTIERALLPAFRVTTGRIVRLERPLRDWKLLDRIYDAYASRYNGMLARSEDWWRSLLSKRKSGTTAVYYDVNDQPSGYVIYEVSDHKMTIKEFVALHPEAMRAIWTFIANHDSMAEHYEWRAPTDDPLPILLDNPRIKQETVPYFMARIVDAEPFMRQFRFAAADAEELLAVELVDEDAPWNNGRFVLRVAADGRVESVARSSSGDAAGDHKQADDDGSALIRCDIRTLTMFLFGYRRPSVLHTFGRIEGSGQAVHRWEARLPHATTQLVDFF